MPANDISPCFLTISAASGLRIGFLYSPTSWRLSLVMPRRDRLMSEVGPEARGSKPVMEVCAHTPERFGMDPAPLVLLPVGAAACPKPGAAAITANSAGTRKFRRRVMHIPFCGSARISSNDAIFFAPALEGARHDAWRYPGASARHR